MIQVLLADDNKISLKYFSTLIDWEKYGFQLISTAIDGQNAWDDFQKYSPQIVITDIQMPIMTGIQLAEKINETNPETIIIFLSSYSEFIYAQAALKLRIFDYLLKHETEKEELINKLKTAKNHLEIENRKKFFLAEGEFLDLYNEISNNDTLENSLKISTLTKKYDLFFLEQNHILDIIKNKLNRNTLELKETDLKQACYKIFPSIISIIKIKEFQYLVLTKPNEDTLYFGYQIKDMLKKEFSNDYSLIIIAKTSFILNSIKKTISMLNSFNQVYFYPVSTILEGEILSNNNKDIKCDLNLTENIQKNLEYLDRWYLYAISEKNYNLFCHITNIFIDYLLTYHLKIINLDLNNIFSIFEDENQYFLYWNDAYSIYHWIKQKYVALSKMILENSILRFSEIVSEIVVYINKNYMEYNISIDYLSSKFEMSPSTLNTLFKKETGNTIWQLIIKTRMENAKKFLDQDKYSITEICELVGYSSLSYFSKVFRKFFNASPEEYKKNKI